MAADPGPSDDPPGTPTPADIWPEASRRLEGRGRRAAARKPGNPALAAIREIALVLAIALGLSLLIKTFLVQAFFIPSSSMEDTLLTGDRVLVSKLTPGAFDLHRGDIVVFSDPGGWLGTVPPPDDGSVQRAIRNALTFVGVLPSDAEDHLIKRVIGLPGDTVACCDQQGRLTVNGKSIEEPYIYPGNKPSEQRFSVKVPAGRLWVMGDHRGVSADSRFHISLVGGGTVSIKNDVVGKAFVIVWPLDRFRTLHNPSATFAGVPNAP